MADDKYTKALYDQLNTKLELGDFNQFQQQLSSDDKFRKAIYDQASVDLDLGDYPVFEGQVKKKGYSLESLEEGKNPLESLGVKSEVPSTPPSPLESAKPVQKTEMFTSPEQLPKVEQPKPAKTVKDYIASFGAGTGKGFAALSDLADKATMMGNDALNQILLGKESANEIKKMREEGILAPAVGGGLRPFQALTQAINYTTQFAKPLPEVTKKQRIVKGVVEGTSQVIPDIMASILFPEVKTAQALQKIVPSLSKFGMLLGTKEAIQKTVEAEGGTALQQVSAPLVGALEGYMTGYTFDNLGVLSGKIGEKIAGKIVPTVATNAQAINRGLAQHTGSTLSNAIFFGGYGNLEEYLQTGQISAETFATNAGMGLALGSRDVGKLMWAKGINTIIGSPKEAINNSIHSKASAEELASQAREKIDAVEKGTSADKEQDIVDAFTLAKTAQMKAVADEVVSNPDEVRKSIEESTLDDKTKEIVLDKIDEIVHDNDQKAQSIQPINDKIEAIDEQLEKIRSNKALSEVEKEAQSAPLKEKKLTLKEEATTALNTFKETFKLGDKEFKSEKELTDWLDKNYNEEDRFSSVNEEGYLEPNTMRVFNKWYEENKKRLAEEDFSRREQEAEARQKEISTKPQIGGQENAERIGEQIESTGQPTQGMVEGEESSLRVRDTSQDRVEAVKGEEIAESKENIPLEGEAVPTKPEEIPIEPPTVEEKPIVATQEIGEEVVPPEPPKPLEEVENAPKEGIHKIGLRAVESTILSDEIKQAVKEGGIDYAIRGKKVRTQEAEEIVKLYDEGGELGRLEEQVYNTDSDIPFDTRTSLNVSIAKHYVNKLNQSTDATERKEIIAKIRESIAFGQERATFYGQAVEAQKDWQEVLGTNPELSVHLKRARVEKEQAEMFKANEKEIDEGYKTFKDFLESEEIVKLIDEKVSEEISKIGTKRFGATDKKKIDDFFEGLKVKTEGKLFDATIAIPISIYNGSIEVIKRSILAGMDIANAVQAGMENLDKWHKEKYERGEITSPEWRKDDYKASLTEKLKPLVKSIKKIKISSIPKEKYKSLVDKMYAKMPMASKSQLRMLVKNALEELTATGEISKESFRNELAKALGKPHITDKQEMDLFNAGMAMKNVRQRGEEVNKAFDEYEKENAKTKPDKIKLKELKKKVDGTIREATKAIYLAQKAQKKTDEIFTDTPDWVDTYVTNIKGGLLTIPSLVVNLTSNIGSPLTRTPKNIIASSLDWMISGVARMYEPIIKKIDPEKSPWLYRQANKLPGSTRTTDFIGYLKGVRIGAGRGIIKGVRQVGTGALPEELLAREISRNLHPIDAAIRLVDMMKGKETASVGKYVQAILEAGPWSYNSEFMFRMLNVGDKPFKEAHYRARLSELANIKGLKGVERERFLEKPDEQSEADAKKTADIAVWQNDNAITKWLRDIERATKHDKGKKDLKTAIMQSTVVRTIARLGLATNAPYVKTPTNIIREGFEYAFPAYSLLRGAESAYNGNRRQALDFIGKAVVGTIIGSIASQLVSKKLISPPPSGDDKERAQQYEQDRPYMLNVSATMRAIEGKDYTPQADDLKVSIKPYGIFSAIMMSYVKAFSDVEPSKIEDMSYIDKMAKVVPAVVSSSLDQSFLAGTSVGLTAFIKGGPEMDKYLVSTSRALSSSLYPNNAAIISKTFFSDNFIRETKDLSVQDDHVQKQIQNDFKDRMFMGKELPAKVSIWGQKVNRIPDGRNWPYMLFDVTKYENNQESTFGTKIWQLYKDYKWINKEDATKLLPSLPSISTEVGWEDRKMTPQEVEEFQMEVGQRRASYVQHYVDSDQWEEDDVLTKGETLSKLYTKARREALANMFDWDETKTQYPEEWKDTYDLGIIPLPSINRKFANTTLSQEDVAIFNRMAADNYVQEISKKKKILESKTEEERQLIANAIWKVYLGKAKVAVWKQNKGKQSR